MTLKIEPYVRIGPLQFGMNQADVVASMGEPQRVTKSRGGNPILWYNNNEVNVIIEGDRLVEVGFGPNAQVSICGMQPFAEPEAFGKLCRLDGNPYEALGSIVLKSIGISLGGFHDNDESQKGITAFERGRWEVMVSQMKRYGLKAAGPASGS